jgi:hypothetical protein
MDLGTCLAACISWMDLCASMVEVQVCWVLANEASKYMHKPSNSLVWADTEPHLVLAGQTGQAT